MNKVKNLKVIGLALCVNASVLTGCSSKHTVVVNNNLMNRDVIVYEENDNSENISIKGNIDYNKIVDNVKVVTFESNGKETTRLVYESLSHSVLYNDMYSYYDLKTGAKIYSYTEQKGVIANATKGINVVNTESFIPYLMEDGNIQYKYDVNELIEIYDEKVKTKK